MTKHQAGLDLLSMSACRRALATMAAAKMTTMDFLVLDGRGGGPGFCNACDHVESLGLTDVDGSRTKLGDDVLTYAYATEEI